MDIDDEFVSPTVSDDDELSSTSNGGGIFAGSHHFTISDGTFTNIHHTHNHITLPAGFPGAPLTLDDAGSIPDPWRGVDLPRELSVARDAIGHQREQVQQPPVRPVHSARGEASSPTLDGTVTGSLGDGAEQAKKPGVFTSKGQEFNFVIPPHDRPLTFQSTPYQITLTLTPVDIEEGYTYQEVVWQTFAVPQTNISKTRKFTARLDPARAFGTANIHWDDINNVALCHKPKCFVDAKPGRPILFKGYVCANTLQYIASKNTRIMARNDDHVPMRLVIGSYIREQDQLKPNWNQGLRMSSNDGVNFQSFIVMDDAIGYGEEVSASVDLILRVYKTRDVQGQVREPCRVFEPEYLEAGQILSPTYVKHKAVPLLSGAGVRLSMLPRVATWLVKTEGQDTQLTMQAPGLWQSLSPYFQLLRVFKTCF
ncbi:hypothetical protein C8R46DRAFT_1141385 [Mycena filopes]|nr:hypothetical protein C8R46DRAFT_1141385 [Mycena filopes]